MSLSTFRSAVQHLRVGVPADQFTITGTDDAPRIGEWNFPIAPPTVDEIAAVLALEPPFWYERLKDEFRAEREVLLGRFVQIAFSVKEEGQEAFAAALLWMRKQVIPLDAHPYVVNESTKGYEQGRQAYKAAYAQLAGQALAMAPDAETQAAWKIEIDKAFK